MASEFQTDEEILENMRETLYQRLPDASHEVRLAFLALVNIASRTINRAEELEKRVFDLETQVDDLTDYVNNVLAER
jgi:uncharacterized protein Yka (UPF0111/DUF47 family)